jgi:hypothetical protein
MLTWLSNALTAAGALLGLAAAPAAVQADRPADPPLKTAPDGRPLTPTFVEDFSAFRTLCGGGRRWRTTFGDGSDPSVARRTLPSNGELEVYVDPCFPGAGAASAKLDPFTRRKSGLDIVADRAPPGLAVPLKGYRYTSGLITTQPSFTQTYGYFEMSARLPRGKGLWPAFWLLPADQSWPPEIDVMESIGDPGKIYQTAHSTLGAPPGHEVAVSSDPDGFHVFAVAWDPKSITWYLDGRETNRVPTPKDMNKPMYMLVNLAVGGHWPGAPDAATPFPARLTVRWVRAYRFAQ